MGPRTLSPLAVLALAIAGCVALDGLAGAAATDLFGGGRFPAVGDDGALEVTLGARGFYWLRLEPVPRVG